MYIVGRSEIKENPGYEMEKGVKLEGIISFGKKKGIPISYLLKIYQKENFRPTKKFIKFCPLIVD